MQRAVGALGRDYARKYPNGPAAATFDEAAQIVERNAGSAATLDEFAASVTAELEARRDAAPDELITDWNRVISAVEAEVVALKDQPMKRPDVLRWIEGLQQALVGGRGPDSVVGKSNSVVDIIKKVYKELSGDPADYRVPDTVGGVADALQSFQTGNTPDDLWHFVTPSYTRANLWLQLKSGDNRDMEAVVRQVDAYIAAYPPPVPLKHEWFGLTYINVVWQQKMVAGMLQAFMGSFLVVFILMTVLFHSPLWGLLSMIPLTVTIALIYGLIGLIGKDYDMPVAVLSSLTLGLAVDFAIHFLARSRALVRQTGSWRAASPKVFGEPARAISRNAIVVAIGFLPLLAAPLMPYKTVGIFMAAILSVAALATLLILPSLAHVLQRRLFARESVVAVTCNCIACVVISIAGVALIAINLHQYFGMSIHGLTWFSLIALPLTVFIIGVLCRRSTCRRIRREQAQQAPEE